MPKITVSKELHARVAAFKQVVETVIDMKISLDQCATFILERGLDAMVADLLGSQEHSILLSSLQQLGSRYPAQVYEYVADTLKNGAAAQEQERMKQEWERRERTPGFRPPEDADAKVS